MNSTKKGLSVLGISLVCLFVGIMLVGSQQKGSLIIDYELDEGDVISWGVFDVYKQDGKTISEFKAVMKNTILAVEDLGIDNDTQDDIAILTEMVLGEVGFSEIKIPMYIDIYTVLAIIVAAGSGDITIPPLSSVHYVSSQGAVAFSHFLGNLTGTIVAEDIDNLTQYLSFFHFGILPTSFDYSYLEDLFLLINELTQLINGFDAFTITNDVSEFKVVMNQSSIEEIVNIMDLLDIDIFETDWSGEYRMIWDKDIDMLTEALFELEYDELGLTRELGMKLVSSTATDKYPNDVLQTEYASIFQTLDETVNTQTVLMIVSLGMGGTGLILGIISMRKLRIKR